VKPPREPDLPAALTPKDEPAGDNVTASARWSHGSLAGWDEDGHDVLDGDHEQDFVLSALAGLWRTQRRSGLFQVVWSPAEDVAAVLVLLRATRK
jgi:hypothetical protein